MLLPEIVNIVFSFCSNNDLISAARVCKVWSAGPRSHLGRHEQHGTVLPCIRRAPDGKCYVSHNVITCLCSLECLSDVASCRRPYPRTLPPLSILREAHSLVRASRNRNSHPSLSSTCSAPTLCSVMLWPLLPRLTTVNWVIDSEVENSVVFLQTLVLFTSSTLHTLVLSLKLNASKVCPSSLYVFASLPDLKLKHFKLTLINIFYTETPLLTLLDRQNDLVELRAPQISFTPQSAPCSSGFLLAPFDLSWVAKLSPNRNHLQQRIGESLGS